MVSELCVEEAQIGVRRWQTPAQAGVQGVQGVQGSLWTQGAQRGGVLD